MKFLLILALLCSKPYLISHGKMDKKGWTLAYSFSLDSPGKIFVEADSSDYLLINSSAAVFLESGLREAYIREGRYFFLLKGPGSWKLFFSPCPVTKGKPPMPESRCKRWVKKQNLIGEGKLGMNLFYEAGVFTLSDVEARAKANFKGKYLWLRWWEDEKIREIPPFRVEQDPKEAHFIYRLVLYMMNSPQKTGLICLPISEDEPSLPGIYRYLGWEAVDIRDFNPIGVRLHSYLILRRRGLSPDEAFTRSDSQARVMFSSPFTSKPGMKEVFELIYRRFFQ